MAVVIGILSNNGAPCVEQPDSPEIDIGPATTLASASVNEYGRTLEETPELNGVAYEGMENIASVREIVVKRKFVCMKKDIPATLAWLASLTGGTIEYNAGVDGTKTIAGNFQLRGRVLFSSYSPSMAACTAEYVGAALDVNFLMPSGITFVKVSSKVWQIKIGTTVAKQYETATDGDGSGIVIAAGGVRYWDEIPSDVRASLPMTMSVLPVDDTQVDTRTPIWMNQYREIHLTVNGEIAKTWYVPCLGIFTRKLITPKRVLMGITEQEYADQSYAMTVPFNPAVNSERYAGNFRYVITGGTEISYVPSELTPAGLNFAGAGLADIANGPYLPPIVETVISPLPSTYTRYVFAGWDYEPVLTAVNNMNPADALVSLRWEQTTTRIRLIANGIDKVDMVLMEYDR